MMAKERFSISAGAIVLLAAIYYAMNTGELLAVLMPVIVHELGHVIALRCFGLSIKTFKLELKGCCIEYSGCAGSLESIAAALAGPFAGVIYALAASYTAGKLNNQWLELSAGVSLLLSAFNLLPVLPLDGGRVLNFALEAFFNDQQSERIMYWCGLILGGTMLLIGLRLMIKGYGVALALAATWILLSQN